MRIVVSGSSGLIGSSLVPALRSAGHEIIRLVRGTAGPGEISWDPMAGRLDPQSLAGVDAAINLAGSTIATRWTEKAKREIQESRVRGTRLLAEALTRALASQPPSPGRGRGTFISVSAIGIYGDRGDEVLTEDSSPGRGFLAEVAQAWEAAAEPARAAGLRVVHPRLGIVLSPRGGALAKMLLPFKLGVGGKVGSGNQWMSWVSLDDVVSAFLFLLQSAATTGVVNVAAPAPVTNAEFTRTLGKTVARPALLTVPPAALSLAYGREMVQETLTGSTRVEPRRLTGAGFAFAFPELSGALRHLVRGTG